MRLISFSVYYFAILLPIFNAVVAAPAPVVTGSSSTNVTPPPAHVASPQSLGGRTWKPPAAHRRLAHIARVARQPNASKVTRPKQPKKPRRQSLLGPTQPEKGGQQHQVAPHSKQPRRQGSMDQLTEQFQKMSIGGQDLKGKRNDQEMSNT
jgi:hypothetical protein